MKEYIEREALLTRNMYGNANPITHRTYAEELIKSAPAADVVEVVRCKDCLYQCGIGCPMFDAIVKDDSDFCSYGERKEKNDR